MILLLSALALADDDEPALEAGETITGDALRPELGAIEERGEEIDLVETDSAWNARVVYGARALSLEEDFVGQVQQGCELIFERNYPVAKKHWKQMGADWPGRGIEHAGLVLVYQSLMMENFDFRWEKSYARSYDAAMSELDVALATPGHEGWDHFLSAAMLGVEAIHLMRKEEYLPAIWRGLEAVEHVDVVRIEAPDFKDVLVGDGLYKYWRSVVTMSYKALPDFGDQRADGIADMVQAEKEAVFLGPGSTLALSFTWIEERKMDKALDSALKNHRAYPDNVVNNLVLARIYLGQRRFRDSKKILDQVIEDAPDNQRVHYYLATVNQKLKDYSKAEEHIDIYLSFDLLPYYEAQAYHRKGELYFRRQEYARAEGFYKKAVKIDGYKPAKKRLEKLKEMRKAGKY